MESTFKNEIQTIKNSENRTFQQMNLEHERNQQRDPNLIGLKLKKERHMIPCRIELD
jgi:hypothetical protein